MWLRNLIKQTRRDVSKAIVSQGETKVLSYHRKRRRTRTYAQIERVGKKQEVNERKITRGEGRKKKVKVILLEVSAQSIVLLGRRHRRRRCRRRRRAHLAPHTARIQRVGTGDYIWGCGIDEEECCVHCERCGYTREPVIVSGSRFRLPRRGEAASRSDALCSVHDVPWKDRATTQSKPALTTLTYRPSRNTRHYATREAVRTRAYSRCEVQYRLLDQRYARAARHAGDQESGNLHGLFTTLCSIF